MPNPKSYWILKDSPGLAKEYAGFRRVSLIWRTVFLSAGFCLMTAVTLLVQKAFRLEGSLAYIPASAALSFLRLFTVIYCTAISMTAVEAVLVGLPRYARRRIRKSRLYIGEFPGHIIVLNDDAVAAFVSGRKVSEIRAACMEEAARLISEYGSRTDSFARAVVHWVRQHRRHPGMVVFGRAVHEIEESQADNPDFLRSPEPFTAYRIAGDEVK